MRPTDDPAVSSGKLVGGYRIEHRLGEGGMGTVYAAVEPTIGKRVAVKVLRRDLATDASFSLRFEREAKSAAQLRHPAVIEIFAYGKLDDGRPYFVMPLLTGRSLREVLDASRRMPPEEAWRVAREIASGLTAAHGFGVLHRDLKPDNVFLVEQPGRATQPVLLDFGLAKIAAGSEAEEDAGAAKLTGTGVPLGTPLYMAPEQWWSAPATEATDQYGFGCLLFEVLAGRPPFEGTKYPELLEAHLHTPPPSLRALGVEVPEAVDAFVTRLLAKEAGDRFVSFDEVVAAGDAAFGLAAAPIAPAPTRSEKTAFAATELQPSTTRARAPQRRLIAYAVTTLAVMSILPLVGYPGSLGRDVPTWMLSIGMGFIPMLAASTIALLTLPACVTRALGRPRYGLLALALVLSPAALALLSTTQGWGIVTGTVDQLAPAAAFEILHMGYYEVSVGRFVGLGLTAALAAGLTVLLGDALAPRSDRTGAPPRAPLSSALAVVAALGAVGLAAAGLSSPSLVVAAAAVRLATDRVIAPVTRERIPVVIDHALAAVIAPLALVGVAFTRVEIASATPFVERVPRSERVAALLVSVVERDLTLYASVLLLLAVAWTSRSFRVFDPAVTRAAWSRLPSGPLVAAAAVALATVADVRLQRDFLERRRALVEHMREQLVFFARLVPPGAASDQALPLPTPATALQISADAMALNGRGLGRIAALESEAGRQAVLRELTAALASPTPGGEGSGVDLSLLIDRRVPVARIRELGLLAHEAGARSAELLLTRGPLADIPPKAPAEAGLLLPHDFVALRVSLVTGTPPEDGETTFEALAVELQAGSGSPLVLTVGRH